MNEAWTGWPDWDGAHPVLVHFPVAWLLAAVACSAAALLLSGDRSRALVRTAFGLLAASAVAAALAVRSGKASAAIVSLPAGGELLLARHQRLGTMLLVAACLLAGLLGAFLFIGPLRRWGEASALRRRFLLAALFATTLAALVLTAATAHAGGRLVHELGVRAWERPGALVPP